MSDAQDSFVANVAKKPKNQGLRVATDLRNEKIALKMRGYSMHKLSYTLVMGDKEKPLAASQCELEVMLTLA